MDIEYIDSTPDTGRAYDNTHIENEATLRKAELDRQQCAHRAWLPAIDVAQKRPKPRPVKTPQDLSSLTL